MNNWRQLKNFVLYKGQSFSKSVFTALLGLIFKMSSGYLDTSENRVIVFYTVSDLKANKVTKKKLQATFHTNEIVINQTKNEEAKKYSARCMCLYIECYIFAADEVIR